MSQFWLLPGLAEKMRFRLSCARPLAASSRLLREGNRSRNLWRRLRAQMYSVERIVIPIRRNSTPCRNGRKSPATPRAIKTHPVRMARQRLNFFVKRSTVHRALLLFGALIATLATRESLHARRVRSDISLGLSAKPIPASQTRNYKSSCLPGAARKTIVQQAEDCSSDPSVHQSISRSDQDVEEVMRVLKAGIDRTCQLEKSLPVRRRRKINESHQKNTSGPQYPDGKGCGLHR